MDELYIVSNQLAFFRLIELNLHFTKSNHREPNFDACDCILYVLCIFIFAMRGNLKGVKGLCGQTRSDKSFQIDPQIWRIARISWNEHNPKTRLVRSLVFVHFYSIYRSDLQVCCQTDAIIISST